MVCIDILQRIPRARPIFIHAIIFDIDARQEIRVSSESPMVAQVKCIDPGAMAVPVHCSAD
jgi:hypothetical protein